MQSRIGELVSLGVDADMWEILEGAEMEEGKCLAVGCALRSHFVLW